MQNSSQVSQTTNGQSSVSGNINSGGFVPASSLIRNRQTPAAPINNAETPSSITGLNSTNSYGTNSSSSVNSFGANGSNLTNNLANPVGSSPVNGAGANSNNGVVNNNSNISGAAVSPPIQRNFVPGLTQPNNINSINRENGAFANTNTRESNNPNVLQNNYRSYRLNSSNYNRSAPSGYQLQPQNNFSNSQNNNFSNNGLNRPNNSFGGQNSNSPATTNTNTSGLQPAGRIQTSEIGR